MTFVPSCSQRRLQLHHFHAVFKTWPTFQELTCIISFRRRCWIQSINFSDNKNIQGTPLQKNTTIIKEIFSLPPDVGVTILDCLSSLIFEGMPLQYLLVPLVPLVPVHVLSFCLHVQACNCFLSSKFSSHIFNQSRNRRFNHSVG